MTRARSSVLADLSWPRGPPTAPRTPGAWLRQTLGQRTAGQQDSW